MGPIGEPKGCLGRHTRHDGISFLHRIIARVRFNRYRSHRRVDPTCQEWEAREIWMKRK